MKNARLKNDGPNSNEERAQTRLALGPVLSIFTPATCSVIV